MLPATVDDPPADPDAVGHRRRSALAELQRVGPIYAILNVLAPFIRLTAIFTFLFGESDGYRELLGAVMSAIAMGAIRPVFFKLAGNLAARTVGEALSDDSSSTAADPPLASSLFHQTQLVWSQALRCALLFVLLATWAFATNLNALRIGYRELPFKPHGHGGHVFPGDVAQQLGAGLLTFLLMAAVWSGVHRISPREKLAADAPNDLSAANEDELLRGMRPTLRYASLLARCASVALETFADVLLVFVFVPSKLGGMDPPSASPLRTAPLLDCVSALVYGSQHLRFRWEWLLCTANGLALCYLSVHYEGSMLATLTAAVCFAVFRHWMRTGLDARRAHKQ